MQQQSKEDPHDRRSERSDPTPPLNSNNCRSAVVCVAHYVVVDRTITSPPESCGDSSPVCSLHRHLSPSQGVRIIRRPRSPVPTMLAHRWRQGWRRMVLMNHRSEGPLPSPGTDGLSTPRHPPSAPRARAAAITTRADRPILREDRTMPISNIANAKGRRRNTTAVDDDGQLEAITTA